MDISKLPRLSSASTEPTTAAPEQPPPEQPATGPALAPSPPERLTYGVHPATYGLGRRGDAFLSIGVGAILLLMYPRFLQWVSSQLFHTHFDPFLDANQNIVPYQKVPEFWSDLGPTLFGVVLLLEGFALIAVRSREVLVIALMLTVLATTYNLVYLVTSFSTYGLAPISALAALFGGYIAMSQWQQLRASTAPDQRVR